MNANKEIPQRVVITGAAGNIGRHFTRKCVDAGISVLAVVRPNQDVSDIVKDETSVLAVNLNEEVEVLANRLRTSDVIVHLAASMSGNEIYANTLSATRGLLSAIEQAGVRHLVLVSSISVIDYSVLEEGTLIDEKSPVCDRDQWLGEYARMKRDQESTVDRWVSQEKERRCIILRAGLVYDNNGMSADHAGLRVANRTICVSHPGQVPVIHIDSLCDALRLTLQQTRDSAMQSQTLHVIDSSILTQTEYVEKLVSSNAINRITTLNWRDYRRLTGVLSGVLSIMGMARRKPDQLRKNSIAGRNKPFKFCNDTASQVLKWSSKR